MKTIFRTYRFEIYPNKDQKILLGKHFGCTRFVFNYFLNQRKEQYQENKKSDGYVQQCSSLTKLKKEESTSWLEEVNSQSLQFSLRCLDASYTSFFKGRTRFPKFKSKKGKNSFTVPQFTRLEGNKVYIPKFKEGIKINLHKEIKGVIGKSTISKTSTGRYFISILSEEVYSPKPKAGKVCGIDLGLKDFVVTSDGVRFKNNKYTKQYERKLAKAQKHLSHKQKDSNSYEKQRRKVAKLYEKISNSRLDNLHKVSKTLVDNYDLIAVEDLNVKGMIKNRRLSKHIADASWGKFLTFLSYKAEWNDKQIVKINRFYPSSKTCHICGYIKQDLNLSIREWTCPNGHKLDRDINAAKNILKEGLKITSAGTADYTSGDSNKTSCKGSISQRSSKPKDL